MRTKGMGRKLLGGVLMSAMTCGLCACGTETGADTAQQEAESAPVEKEEAAPVDLDFTVSYEGIATNTIDAGVSVHDPSIYKADGKYYIKNTSPNIKNGTTEKEVTPIGVTAVDVQSLTTNTWKIVNEKTDIGAKDSDKMTFKLGSMNFGATMKEKGLDGTPTFGKVSIYSAKSADANYWANYVKTNSSDFIKKDFYEYKDTGSATATKHTGLTQIGKGTEKLDVKLESEIANLERTKKNDGKTVGMFKVMYTLAPLDSKTGLPLEAGVYAGDEYREAGYTKDLAQ